MMTDHSNARGSGDSPAEPLFFVVGKILRPHGVRGELKAEVLTKNPDWLAELDMVYLGIDQYDRATATAYELDSMRRHRNQLLLRLKGIDSREDADRLREKLLMIRVDQAQPLEEGEFYSFQLLGMAVYTTSGDYLGDLMEIIETGANDVYLLQGSPRGDILIPDTDEVIEAIDLDERRMTINPIPGLLDEG